MRPSRKNSQVQKKICPKRTTEANSGRLRSFKKKMKLDFSRRKKVACKELDFYPIYGLFWKKMPEARVV
jgi:hypothetical protein